LSDLVRDPLPDAAAAAPASVRKTRWVAVASLVALIALGLAWELWLAPTGRGTLALKVLPLLLPLPGILKNRMYTYRWLSLLLWLYVAEGLVRATSEAGIARALATAEVGLALALFGICVYYIRRRLQPAAVPA